MTRPTAVESERVLAEIEAQITAPQLDRLADKLHGFLHRPTLYPGNYSSARSFLLDVLRECL